MQWTLLSVYLWLSVGTSLASYCYPDYCQNLTILEPIPGFQCILTRVQTDKDCTQFEFGEATSQKDASKFLLSAYVKSNLLGTQRVTAFNLSIANANFQRLVTRYQNLQDMTQSACRYIELYGNDTHPPPTELYVSCPFSNSSFESFSYQLQYLVTGRSYKYSRQLVFKVPLHSLIGDHVPLTQYTLFAYIDISDMPEFSLYVQTYPMKFNVTKYRVWIIQNDTSTARVTDIDHAVGNGTHIRYNFTVDAGIYYLKVTGLHPDCGDIGCANSTTPFVFVKEDSRRILIMIISTVWIPPVALYAMYHIYKLYKEREIIKRGKGPSCLLMYSPTRLTHINVMTELAKYLRECGVNAMVDMLDVAGATDKDPAVWCNSAFSSAETIVIASSPSAKETAVSNIYRSTHDHLLRLLGENIAKNDKTYCVIYFPYSEPDSVPEEARNLQRFFLPNDLPRFIKVVRKKDCNRRHRASEDQLLHSINLAKTELFDESNETGKDTSEIDGLLKKDESKMNDNAEHSVIPHSFMTNIDELNLLGETEENKEQTDLYKPATSRSAFHIDQLNL